MSAQAVRARQLMGIGRWQAAAEALQMALAENPEDALNHALLAQCWSNLERPADARREAERAVQLAPSHPTSHWVLGQVLLADQRTADAERAAREALRLDVEDADHHHLLAAILAQRDQASAALAQVDAGLAVDPEHRGLTDLRGALLTRLGRHDEAESVIAEGLRRDPDAAEHHANAGWMHLRQRDHARAAQHFSEALRLDPTDQAARAGLVEALKARYLIYRIFLAWLFWLATLSPTARWVVILGGYLAYRFASRVADIYPQWSLWLSPVVWLYLGFAFLTWTAIPVFNLLLYAHPLGRHALSDRERSATLGTSAVIGVGLIGVASYPLTGHAIGLLIALICAQASAVLYPALEEAVARHRRIQVSACAMWGLFQMTALALIFAEESTGARMLTWGLYGWIALIFLPSVLRARGR